MKMKYNTMFLLILTTHNVWEKEKKKPFVTSFIPFKTVFRFPSDFQHEPEKLTARQSHSYGPSFLGCTRSLTLVAQRRFDIAPSSSLLNTAPFWLHLEGSQDVYTVASFPIPPVVVKTIGVKLPRSMSLTLCPYPRFFLFSCGLYKLAMEVLR